MPLQHEQVECKLITAMDYEDIVIVEGGDRRRQTQDCWAIRIHENAVITSIEDLQRMTQRRL